METPGTSARRALLVAFTLGALLLPGCLAAGGGVRVQFDEEIRLPVRFESSEAVEHFDRGRSVSDRSEHMNQGGFFIFALWAGGGATFHETQHYNAQVRLADADRDGVITLAEAKAYRGYAEARAAEREDDD